MHKGKTGFLPGPFNCDKPYFPRSGLSVWFGAVRFVLSNWQDLRLSVRFMSSLTAKWADWFFRGSLPSMSKIWLRAGDICSRMRYVFRLSIHLSVHPSFCPILVYTIFQERLEGSFQICNIRPLGLKDETDFGGQCNVISQQRFKGISSKLGTNIHLDSMMMVKGQGDCDLTKDVFSHNLTSHDFFLHILYYDFLMPVFGM